MLLQIPAQAWKPTRPLSRQGRAERSGARTGAARLHLLSFRLRRAHISTRVLLRAAHAAAPPPRGRRGAGGSRRPSSAAPPSNKNACSPPPSAPPVRAPYLVRADEVTRTMVALGNPSHPDVGSTECGRRTSCGTDRGDGGDVRSLPQPLRRTSAPFPDNPPASPQRDRYMCECPLLLKKSRVPGSRVLKDL